MLKLVKGKLEGLSSDKPVPKYVVYYRGDLYAKGREFLYSDEQLKRFKRHMKIHFENGECVVAKLGRRTG